jgi:hypothetical protein
MHSLRLRTHFLYRAINSWRKRRGEQLLVLLEKADVMLGYAISAPFARKVEMRPGWVASVPAAGKHLSGSGDQAILNKAAAKAASKQTPGGLLLAFAPAKK